MDILLKISLVLAIGIIGGKVAKLVKLPSVSGYLVFGLFLGPSFFNLVNQNDLNSLNIISELALAFIAFSIGSEFSVKSMMKYGKKIFVITLTEVVGAVFVVFSVMYFIFDQSFAFSAVIASMSAATAPAATLLVMKQYRANGPLTKTLLPVVALDDVYGIIVFGVAISLAQMSVNLVPFSFKNMVMGPLLEIGGSLALGLVLGLLLVFISKKQKERDDLQVLSLIAIGIGVGVAKLLGFSPLLTNIVIGTTVVNLLPRSEKVFSSVNDFVSPFYVLFFALAGASLDLSVLLNVGIIGASYIFCRGFGKYVGAMFGAKIMKAEKTVTRYLGFGLLPQGGISIGLSVLVREILPSELATVITTIIMFSVLVYETSGPIFAKIAISKAGEINGLDKTVSIENNIEPEKVLQTA